METTKTDAGGLTARFLQSKIGALDRVQGRRYGRLEGPALAIANEGLIRHLRACERMEVRPDVNAIREIIDDALNGRSVYSEVNNDRQRAA
jgi:hypothetical protein